MICESRLQQITRTLKFTKLANMITLKRSFIVQSQKLVTAYTRPQVRIVSFNFSDNYNIKQNTTMNVNRSQKHGPILHYIIQAKSKTTKITVMHHTLTHFNSKSVKNPYFCIYFQCENRKNDLILIMTPEKQDKTLELSKHWSVDSTPARNEMIMKRTYPVKSVKCDKICSNY